MLTTNAVEYQNALNFLQVGCDCGCSAKLPHEKFAQFRSDFQNLPKPAQDASIMTQLTFMSGGKTTTSPRLKNKERTNQRTFYQWDNKTPLCQKAYLNMLGISHKYLENIKEHLRDKGFTTRTHGNVGRKPHWNTKMNIDQNIRKEVKNFLLNYAKSYGYPNPMGKTKRTIKPIIELPTDTSYASVHRDFLASLEENNHLKQLKYHTFYKLWKRLVPHIQFKTPRTDLCDTCHQLRNELHSCKDKTIKTQIKNELALHKSREKQEREYYNKNIKLVKSDKRLVEDNYVLNHLFSYNKVGYCSVNATAHYSFDWSQNVHAPHFDQQPSQIHFRSPRKIGLFGVQNEATGEQINYVIGEDELLNKGPNGTLSLVFDAIRKFNKGEKHLKLTCDNAVGQNKNNATIQFCQFLVLAGYYESVELNFMIAGHTKFNPDGKFGLIKKRYRKSTIHSVNQFTEIVDKSSPAELNKVQCYERGKGFKYFDFKEKLEPYFIKLPDISKYHRFYFSSDNLNIVRVQDFVGNPFVNFNLWKDRDKITASIEEIRNSVFPTLKPKPLSYERQEYLYQKVRPWVKEEFRDITCPEPKPEGYIEPKYMVVTKSNQKYLDISRKFYISPDIEEEVEATSGRKLVYLSDVGLSENLISSYIN